MLRVGRTVSALNQLLAEKQFILMGPGRWGSRGDIKLGVSVTYADINNTRLLVEIARPVGDFVRSIPQIVMISLSCSYAVAMLVTPTLAAIFFRPLPARAQREGALRRMFYFLLRRGLRHKAAAIAIAAAWRRSVATPWTVSSPIDSQSDTTNPSKPHSSRKIAVRSVSFSPHQSPLTELYALITEATPASATRCG